MNELTVTSGAVDGVRGEHPGAERRRARAGELARGDGRVQLRAQAVIVTSGGIGANHDLVRRNWPERLGTPPRAMLSGVPEHVDGRMLAITEAAGGRIINPDRMWHYTEGIQNWDPDLDRATASASCPARPRSGSTRAASALPVPLFPGFDTMATLAHICGARATTIRWFILTQKIIKKEFALSGSEQNPDLTNKSIAAGPGPRHRPQGAWPGGGVQGARRGLRRRAHAAGAGRGDERADRTSRCSTWRRWSARCVARDREIANPFTKDSQIAPIRGARRYLGDRLIRIAPPHRLLDPAAGPLIAVRLHILTRKTLGGLETDLSARVLGADGQPRARPLRGGRGGGLRRRRHARLQRAGRHLPRRLPLLRPHGGPRGGGGGR